jgi:hypothetical protein
MVDFQFALRINNIQH